MKWIKVRNFRCYDEKEIEFRSGVNLLIGNNSVGKTSLLLACNYVMSAFFSGYSKPYTRWISAAKDDFLVQISDKGSQIISNQIDVSFSISERDLFPLRLSDGSVFNFDYDIQLKIEKKSSKNARPLTSGVKYLKEYGAMLAKNDCVMKDGALVQINPLPVYTFFSTEDIHTGGRKIDKSGFKKEKQFPSFGYFECHDSKGLFSEWVKRLLILQEVDSDLTEINNVRSAIIEALGPDGCDIIYDMRLIVNKKQLYFRYKDGREVECSMLSDGYRRLVNIITDIAIRCAILNKEIYGDEAYKKTHGTVIIDEIDEHLHPSLQVRIMKAMHNTFPKIQFIVSTHAPLVISSVEPSQENVVYKLDYKGGKYIHKEMNYFGMDATTIMETAMEQTARDLEVDAKLKHIFGMIDKDEITGARRLLAELQNRLSNGNPELSRAEALISFLED